jgi:hypothetical protein
VTPAPAQWPTATPLNPARALIVGQVATSPALHDAGHAAPRGAALLRFTHLDQILTGLVRPTLFWSGTSEGLIILSVTARPPGRHDHRAAPVQRPSPLSIRPEQTLASPGPQTA